MSSFDSFRDALRALAGRPLAIDERRAGGFTAAVTALARGENVSENALRALTPVRAERVGLAAGRGAATGAKGIAVLSMHGVSLYDLEYQPYCFSTRRLAEKITEAAADSSVRTIVLDINTPGGHVTGTAEAVDAVYKAARKKPVIGIINPLCASAGYWNCSQCSKLIAVRSADVGSIGVFMTHYDCSAMLANEGIKPTFIYAGPHKTEGNSLEPLTAEARAYYQREVDTTYDDFLSAVARGRSVSKERARITFGGGRVLRADAAERVGMINAIAPSPGLAMSAAIDVTNKATADYRARRLKLESFE